MHVRHNNLINARRSADNPNLQKEIGRIQCSVSLGVRRNFFRFLLSFHVQIQTLPLKAYKHMTMFPHEHSYVSRNIPHLTTESLCLFVRKFICDHIHKPIPPFMPTFSRSQDADVELSERQRLLPSARHAYLTTASCYSYCKYVTAYICCSYAIKYRAK